MEEKKTWREHFRDFAGDDRGWDLLTGDSVDRGAADLAPGAAAGLKAILLGGLAAGILAAVWYWLAAASVLAILWGVVRLVSLNQNFRLLVSGQALIMFLLIPRIFAPAGVRQPIGLLLLIPIPVVVLAIVRLIRQADELQKRIVLESFAVAFITTLVAVTLAVFGERYGVLPRFPTATWMLVLVISPGIGYLLAARRYRA